MFYWRSLNRQVRARGSVSEVTPQEADAYFATRPRGAQIAAWASQQSRPLESMFALEKAVGVHTAKFLVGKIPRPPHWSGFRITPVEIEFWQFGYDVSTKTLSAVRKRIYRADQPGGRG